MGHPGPHLPEADAGKRRAPLRAAEMGGEKGEKTGDVGAVGVDGRHRCILQGAKMVEPGLKRVTGARAQVKIVFFQHSKGFSAQM